MMSLPIYDITGQADNMSGDSSSSPEFFFDANDEISTINISQLAENKTLQLKDALDVEDDKELLRIVEAIENENSTLPDLLPIEMSTKEKKTRFKKVSEEDINVAALATVSEKMKT